MLKDLWHKLKEALVSVLPVTLIVLILSFTPLIDLKPVEFIFFLISAFVLILGVGLFNLGADIAMSPMGEQVGASIIKTKKIRLIAIIFFIMGLCITIAEPDLSVLAGQVSGVIDSTILIVTIGLGVGLFLVLGVLKIIYKKDLSSLLMYFYLALFAAASIVIVSGNGKFLALAFDSGGVTTGPITVPFIMTLGVGVAATLGGRNAKENSFGLIALCSIGPILVVLLLGIGIDGNKLTIDTGSLNYEVPNTIKEFFINFIHELSKISGEVLIALSMIVGCFLIIQAIFIKLPKSRLIKIFFGIFYTFIGLVLFLTSATVGFLPIGYKLGCELANDSSGVVAGFGFLLGLVVVLAEPAIHVLTKQVEEVTTGGVSKLSMLLALSIGVGISLCLSMIRIIYDFSILYYVIPGYLISLGLSFFVPKIYTAIAFDSGGVASGPLTSSFILPFAVGVCSMLSTINGTESKVLENAFGVVAMVAMTPLITIQLLGFKDVIAKKVRENYRMKKISDSDDAQIINFM